MAILPRLRRGRRLEVERSFISCSVMFGESAGGPLARSLPCVLQDGWRVRKNFGGRLTQNLLYLPVLLRHMDALNSKPPTEGSDDSASPLRRGLDTLRVKLFLAIAGAHLVLVAAVYLIYSWSFDKGLVDYVNQSERARLVPVISQLADGYQQHGNWEWVTEDRERWFNVLREVLGWRVG